MVELILRLRDRDRAGELEKYGAVVHVCRRADLVVVEVPPENVGALRSDPNVLAARESEAGTYRV